MALEAAGAIIVVAPDGGIAAALGQLPALGIQSLLVEGGATLQTALWDAGLVDYVQLYETSSQLGIDGVPLPKTRSLLADDLLDRRVTVLGPDVLTEGYVHRPC